MNLKEILLVIIIAGTLAAAAVLIIKSMLRQQKAGKGREELIKEAIKKADGAFRKMLLDKDEQAVRSDLSPIFSLFVHKNPYRIDGIDESMKTYKSIMVETQSISVYNQNVTMLNEEAVLVTYNFSFKEIRADKPFEGTGKTTHVWRKESTQWKLVHDHTSYNQPI